MSGTWRVGTCSEQPVAVVGNAYLLATNSTWLRLLLLLLLLPQQQLQQLLLLLQLLPLTTTYYYYYP